MPQPGYTKSRYQLEGCRYLKVPLSIYHRLFELYGMKWSEVARDALFELAAKGKQED